MSNDKKPGFPERVRLMQDAARSLSQIAEIVAAEAAEMAIAEKRFAEKRAAKQEAGK